MRLVPFTTALASALAVLVVGCAREGAPPVVAVEVAIAELPDAGPALTTLAPLAASPSPRTGRCTARLRALPIRTGAGCTLDERISKSPGTLTFPCSGEGPVEAVFGEHRFEGQVAEGALQLTLHTELDWQDGCHWETNQAVRASTWERDRERGRGDTGARTTPRTKLAWTYTEQPVHGTGCYGSCIASAEIEVLEETAAR